MMDKELENLLDNYENVIYGKSFPINPSIHQLHLLLDYIANLEQQCKKQKEVIDRIDKYIKPLITNRDDEQYYDINWYNKDVLLSMLKEVSE